MRHEVAETMREALLLDIVEMRLVAEEDNLVPQKDLVDRSYRLLRQVAGKPYVPDLRADTSRKRDSIGFRDGLLYGCKFGHGNLYPLGPRAAGNAPPLPAAQRSAELTCLVTKALIAILPRRRRPPGLSEQYRDRIQTIILQIP
jgi:hypothetical protein